jgi:hypothetical protein
VSSSGHRVRDGLGCTQVVEMRVSPSARWFAQVLMPGGQRAVARALDLWDSNESVSDHPRVRPPFSSQD